MIAESRSLLNRFMSLSFTSRVPNCDGACGMSYGYLARWLVSAAEASLLLWCQNVHLWLKKIELRWINTSAEFFLLADCWKIISVGVTLQKDESAAQINHTSKWQSDRWPFIFYLCVWHGTMILAKTASSKANQVCRVTGKVVKRQIQIIALNDSLDLSYGRDTWSDVPSVPLSTSYLQLVTIYSVMCKHKIK